jgi:transposase-like protein
MSGKRYSEEFKLDASKQVTEPGHPAPGTGPEALESLILAFLN